MQSSSDQIRNLVYRYSEAVDTGRFDLLGGLFEHATFRTRLGDQPPREAVSGRQVADTFKDSIILYGDGTPRTRHLVSNLIVEVDEDAGRATARSYNTTLQQAPGRPIEIIATARYHDAFERVGGTWRFAERVVLHSSADGVARDFIGDMGFHVRAQ
jgi:hypothetical protein